MIDTRTPMPYAKNQKLFRLVGPGLKLRLLILLSGERKICEIREYKGLKGPLDLSQDDIFDILLKIGYLGDT